jgi:glycine/sarcosine N-methyltransferase
MAFYKSIAAWYDEIFPFTPLQVTFLEKQLGSLSGKEILDVGCGTGNLSIALGAKGVRVTGIDLDEQMLDIATAKSGKHPNLNFKAVNMLKIDEMFRPASLDAVICFGNTLVHLLKPGEIYSFFSQCERILKPDGMLLIQIINYDHILDNGLEGLPTIQSDKIKFERIYELREQDELINFKTILTIKETDEIIRNSVPLLPIRRDFINKLLAEAGFGQASYYSSFDSTPLLPGTFPLIIAAEL